MSVCVCVAVSGRAIERTAWHTVSVGDALARLATLLERADEAGPTQLRRHRPVLGRSIYNARIRESDLK